jgi:hypothetical protein
MIHNHTGRTRSGTLFGGVVGVLLVLGSIAFMMFLLGGVETPSSEPAGIGVVENADGSATITAEELGPSRDAYVIVDAETTSLPEDGSGVRADGEWTVYITEGDNGGVVDTYSP